MRMLLTCFTAVFVLAFAGVAKGDFNYDESIDGDLSDQTNPTDLGVAGLGSNTVTGQLNTDGDFDTDAFLFAIEFGHQLDSLAFTSMNGSTHFFAFNDGPLDDSDPAGNLISTLVSDTDVGVNILDGTLNSFGGSGLPGGPLGPGTYYVWFREGNESEVNYSIAINTSESIPEPASMSILVAFAVGGLCVRRRRK